MDNKRLLDGGGRKHPNKALIVRRAASKRGAINEFQAQHLCALARHMVQAVVDRSEVDSVADLPEDGWETFTKLTEYQLFSVGAYACGFVCNDLPPDADLNFVMLHPRDALLEMSLPQLRHYIHTLMRAERAGHGYGSVIYEALRAGVFQILCERLESGSDLYESL